MPPRRPRTIGLLVLGLIWACDAPKPIMTSLVIFNLTEAPVDCVLDGAKMTLKARSRSVALVKKGNHEVVVTQGGNELERQAFATDPSTDTHLVYNVGAKGLFALIDTAGAYTGGGIFSLTDDKSFPIVKVYEGQKVFRLDTHYPAFLTLPMERMAQSPPSTWSNYFLCPIEAAWKGDDAKIRQQCLGLMKLGNR